MRDEKLLPDQMDCGGEDFRLAVQQVTKNSLFSVNHGILKVLADFVQPQYKTRIVLDYDPDALNWTLRIFTDKDAPIVQKLR